MNIAVLFDGAGLSRLGLEQAGHECTGVEISPTKHYLSKFVGSGNTILCDATKFDLSQYEAVWASPPCQIRSTARLQQGLRDNYSQDYLRWCLDIPKLYPNVKTLWVENVITFNGSNTWGNIYNAAQFLQNPIQSRNRIIGGNYIAPLIFRQYKKYYRELNLCPTITATEYQGHANDWRRASRYYGRKLTMSECAYHQGFDIPEQWFKVPLEKYLIDETTNKRYTISTWTKQIYEAIGNGVPVYMAKSFGEMYI